MPKKSKPEKPNPHDAFMRATDEVCAKAMVEWFKTHLNVNRAICTLNIEEMKLLASVATIAFILEVDKRASEHPQGDYADLREWYLL